MAGTASGRPSAIGDYEIDLDPGEAERWITLAAEASGCGPDDLAIECAARPAFLEGDALLLLLRYRGRGPIVEQAWWWSEGEQEEDRDILLWCLAGHDDQPRRRVLPLRDARDFLATLGWTDVYRIDADTALDYLRVFADFARTRDAVLAGARVLLIERLEDVEFWVALNDFERERVVAALAADPLTDSASIRHGYRATCLALVDDGLRRVICTVYDRPVPGLGEVAALRGEIRVELAEDEPLLTGLPVGYLRSLLARPSTIHGRQGYQESPDGWRRLAKVDANTLIDDVNRRVLPLVAGDDLTRIALRRLPFYPLDLLRVSDCIHNGDRTDRFLLWRPGLAVSLDTRSDWINTLNEHLARHEHWSLRTADDVAAYLKFFGDFVWGDEGPFHIVTGAGDSVSDAADPGSGTVLPGVRDTLGLGEAASVGDVTASVEDPDVGEPDGEGWWPVIAFVRYGAGLFAAKFRVSPHGLVEMLDDTPLVSWEPAEESGQMPEPPARGLEPPIASQTEPTLKSVTGEHFAAELRAARDSGSRRPAEIRDRVVCGRVDLRGESIGSVVITNCRFRGTVNLDHLECSRDLVFRHCVFENGLRLAEATIRGRLHLRDVIVRGHVTLTDQEAIVHSGGVSLTCHESRAAYVTLVRVNVGGTLLAERLRVQGNLEFLSVQTLRSTDLMSSQIGQGLIIASESAASPTCIYGDLNLDQVVAHSVLLRGLFVLLDLNLQYAFAEQWISLEGLNPGGSGALPLRVGHYPWGGGDSGPAGGISVYGTVVEKNFLILTNVDVAGGVKAAFVRVGTGLWLEPDRDHPGRNRIGADVELDGAVVPQILRIRRTDIGGDLSGRALQTGELRLVGRMKPAVTDDDGNEIVPPDYEPIAIAGKVNLQDAMLEGEAYIVGVRIGESLNLRHASVDGDLTLSIGCAQGRERGLTEEQDADVGYLLAETGGGINLRKAMISGDVVLSGADCAAATIDMGDAEIKRDVEIVRGPGRARAKALILDGLRCDGNLDFSGLSLSAACAAQSCPGHGCNAPECEVRRTGGHVLARGATVAGLLRTATETETAEIPGCLDLSFSDIGTLEISVDTFPLAQEADRCNDRERAAEACGVILRRATVGMLSLTVDERGYPRPVDLGYTEIKWWQFNHRVAGGDRAGRTGESPGPGTEGSTGTIRIRQASDEAGDYIDLLFANEKDLQRHTWRSIENNLFNWGHETAADDVHRAMRRWLRAKMRREGPPPGIWNRLTWLPKRIGRRLFDLLTREVTEPVPAVLIMLGWTLVSTWLFSLPVNIGLSEPGYLTLPEGQRYETEHPDPESWGLGAGFWTALHFHVPVALFTARDEWEPASDRSLAVYGRDGRYVLPGVTPEDYANIVLIAHWFMWPVVLVLYSRRYLRRAQQ